MKCDVHGCEFEALTTTEVSETTEQIVLSVELNLCPKHAKATAEGSWSVVREG